MTANYATARRCGLTELLVDQCGHCRRQATPDEGTAALRRALLGDGWTAARWPGSCARCGEVFGTGAAIRAEGDGWRAECCCVGWAP